MARDCGFFGVDKGGAYFDIRPKDLTHAKPSSRAEFYTERGWDKVRVFADGALKRVIRRRAMPSLSDDELARL